MKNVRVCVNGKKIYQWFVNMWSLGDDPWQEQLLSQPKRGTFKFSQCPSPRNSEDAIQMDSHHTTKRSAERDPIPTSCWKPKARRYFPPQLRVYGKSTMPRTSHSSRPGSLTTVIPKSGVSCLGSFRPFYLQFPAFPGESNSPTPAHKGNRGFFLRPGSSA